MKAERLGRFWENLTLEPSATIPKFTMVDQRFRPGDLVQRVNQPESTGVVRESRWNSQVERWDHIVQFGSQRVGIPEALLQPLITIISPWQALEEGQLSGRNHFISCLTLERLEHPPARIANSFATAKTRFYPYQFKPLLKFLDHPGKRLLIADDVGLGKTIEAGYILRELDAHKKLERILVLVPARLATKWKKELDTKFDEQFEKVKGRDLLDQARKIASGQEPESFRWIVSYESVRSDEIRNALDSAQLPLDILIADEAHRMRNSESLQHKIGAVLSRCADAAIFLSATPVMNKLEDLWQLLKLLSPEEFSFWEVFRRRIHSNQFILAAQRALSIQPPRWEEAQKQIERFATSTDGPHTANDFLLSVQERLRSTKHSKREMIELQSDLGRLSPIGHVVSRTRKADAVPDRPQRSAHWQRVELTEVEREIYQSVESLCREARMGGTTPWGFEMSLLMAYRATASCIPAAIDYFADKLRNNSAVELDDFEEEGESYEDDKPTAWSSSLRSRFKELVDLYKSAEPPDSKLKALLETLRDIWADDDANAHPRRKIVIFSFFRGTLNYLARTLRSRGIENCKIHGGVSIPDREQAVDDFLRKSTIPVLLTSEVGGEGIDLVQASVVVNYDLPWNPMVVEQRIGRIDRIGQEAKKIIIRNLVVQGSVEERVLSRLLSKIAVFLETVGDLEPIIGEQIEKLTTQALTGELSNEEIERRIEEQASILDKTRLDAIEILSQADGLLAADQALVDEISALTEDRQLPSQEEVLLFLNRFLERFYPGCQLPSESDKSVVSVDLTGSLALDVELAGRELGSDVSNFGKRLSGGPVDLTLSREVAYRLPRAELIHLQHPLSRFAVSRTRQESDVNNSAFSLTLQTRLLPPGRYAFLLASADIHSQRSNTRMICICISRENNRVWIDPDTTTPLLVEILREGEDVCQEKPTPQETQQLKDRLTEGLTNLITEWESREATLDRARQQRLHNAQLSVLEFKRKRAQQSLQNLQGSNAAEFRIRMEQGKVAKALREEAEVLNSPTRSTWGGITQREIAVGLLLVTSRSLNG